MELLASQHWVQSQCSQLPVNRILESDMLGDKSLTPYQARHLLLLLCPCAPNISPNDIIRVAKYDPASALKHILKVCTYDSNCHVT